MAGGADAPRDSGALGGGQKVLEVDPLQVRGAGTCFRPGALLERVTAGGGGGLTPTPPTPEPPPPSLTRPFPLAPQYLSRERHAKKRRTLLHMHVWSAGVTFVRPRTQVACVGTGGGGGGRAFFKGTPPPPGGAEILEAPKAKPIGAEGASENC